MALFLKERIDEQPSEDPFNDRITFRYPWIITIPPATNENQHFYFSKKFGTSYQFGSETWYMSLSNDGIGLNSFEPIRCWNGSYFVSYDLYYDNDMRFLFHSSVRAKMMLLLNDGMFKTPVRFMAKLSEAFEQRKITKVVVHLELRLPAKFFCCPYTMPSCGLKKTFGYDKFPKDLQKDFRFGFIKNGDFVIRCPDGMVPARRIILNLASEHMKKHFETSPDAHELVVDHLIDVVEPIVYFMHSLCFKMPKVYDFDYAKRLLIALDFFKLEQKTVMKNVIHVSVCQKFAHDPHDFDSVLQWTSISSRHSLNFLQKMVATLIANKYYFKWQHMFPENARNLENPEFLDIFGSETSSIFGRIDKIFANSFLTNVILD